MKISAQMKDIKGEEQGPEQEEILKSEM